LTSVRATTAILNDLPQSDWLGFIGILLAFDLIYTTVCFLGFEFVVED
ncbi:MAG: cytochrome C biogenesis protein, partial [Blastochloris sp.]|nr:cytochrome C biogenesis protein [Blastochloris sp.]